MVKTAMAEFDNLIPHKKPINLLKRYEVQILVRHIRISTINDFLMMLAIETVFGTPYNLPQLRKDSEIR